MSVAGAARWYARHGYAVLPVYGISNGTCACGATDCSSPGKHPLGGLVPRGLKDATTDVARIKRWWTQRPTANIGIATGAVSGLVVLDVDPRNGGDASLAALEREFGPLPETVVVKTGNGHHYWFRHPGGQVRNRSGVRPGIDVKADLAYIVGPPSLHRTGRRYAFPEGRSPSKHPIAAIPDWLLHLIRSDAQPASDVGIGWRTGGLIPDGQRNDALYRKGRSLKAQGASRNAIARLLLEVNATQCRPPLDRPEVLRIAENVWRQPDRADFAHSCQPEESDDDAGHSAATKPPRKKDPTQSSLIVRLAGTAELFRTAAGPHARYPVGPFFEVAPLPVSGAPTSRIGEWLAATYFDRYGAVPQAPAITDAVNVLRAKAAHGPVREIHHRIARHGGKIFIDLANDAYEVVEIAPDGWRLVVDPPVLFVRSPNAAPLPRPERGGRIKDLRRFVNVPDDDALVLLVAWLLGALYPDTQFPILVLYGEKGVGKTTTLEVVRSLVDPVAAAATRSLPKNERELFIAAHNAHLLAFCNLSTVPDAMSDALCRTATGSGYATRQLYTDAAEIVFAGARPIALDAIPQVAARSDLLDRSITLHLAPLDTYVDADAFWEQWHGARPRIFGALCDAMVVGLNRIERTRPSGRARMASFERWVRACEPALGWRRGRFVRAYHQNRSDAIHDHLAGSLVARAIQRLVRTIPPGKQWYGPAATLLQRLNGLVGTTPIPRSARWPKTPSALSAELNRLAPDLRRVGIAIETGRRSGPRGDRHVIIRRVRPEA